MSEDREEEYKEEQKEKKKKTRLEQDLENLSISSKELMEKPENQEFKETILRFIKHIENLNFLNEEEVRKEIAILSDRTAFSKEEVVDINAYQAILTEIQIAKDRVCTLFMKAIKDYNLIESVYSTLLKIWTGKYSKLTSDKRREGEAEQILSWMLFIRIDRKTNYDILKKFHENLSSKSEVISRKITIYQENNRILGRGIHYTDEEREQMKNINNPKSTKKSGEVGWKELK